MRLDTAPIARPDRFYIGGQWVEPSTADQIVVIDPGTEEPFFAVAEAKAPDMARAVESARSAFDQGPWRHLSHAERADYLRSLAAGMMERADALAQIWPRQSGVVHAFAQYAAAGAAGVFNFFADASAAFPWEQQVTPQTPGEFGLLVREPVGVVGAIVPWNAPAVLMSHKVAPALLAGCTVVLKASPEAPGEAYVLAEVAEAIGLPPGVLNVVTADREVSELLVSDPRVDKISFTGSTAAGRRVASICGERVARVTLELGGKSAAVILDDADLATAAATLARAECMLNGQVCASLTRIVVSENRHDEFVEALADNFAQVTVGDPFDSSSQVGPLAMRRQRERVEGYIAKGIAEGAKLMTGGGRPAHLERGFYVEPTVFANVDNRSTIAQEEIFGPVLSVIPATNEEHAIELANDTIYGLNAAVFTEDADRAHQVAGRLQSGTVGHNGFRFDLALGFGGYKQSGIGREGGEDGIRAYIETKSMILRDAPAAYRTPAAAP